MPPTAQAQETIGQVFVCSVSVVPVSGLQVKNPNAAKKPILRTHP
jgi:hypothetical protein